MSLAHATDPEGAPLGLRAPAPCSELGVLLGVPFELPCEDPWLLSGDSPGRTYLEAARQGWVDHPDYMDFLDLASPAYDIKRASRDLYLHHLLPLLEGVETVLDVGCGIGRLTHPLLDRGKIVVGVDGDLHSLRRCAWHAIGRDGALDLRWSTPSRLPDGPFDLALAVEVLCYLDDPEGALRAIATRVRPGGSVFLYMEARWGWASAPDAPVDGIEVALGQGRALLHLPGDRYVHLFDAPAMDALIRQAGLEPIALHPTHHIPDGPLEDLLPATFSMEELLDLERRCAQHPVWAPLNRIWTAIARKP